MAVAALILAAGRGERLGGEIPKAFVPLLGRPLLVRSLEAVAAAPEVARVVPVVAAADLDRYRGLECGGIAKLVGPVVGGAERQDSVRAGLAALPADIEWVAVHDAARCLVRSEDISRVIAAARQCGAALLAHPVRDTIKRVREDRVIETPARSECWAAETPQVFRVDLLREAMAKADAEGFRGTDDAELVERLGADVRVVEGDPHNIKVTVSADIAIAEAWLRGEGES